MMFLHLSYLYFFRFFLLVFRNDANDAIEMEFISDDRIKKERDEDDVLSEKVYVVKRPNVSLLQSYKHNWKSRHNHFLRYSDVKPKDERRPTVTDLANQKQVVQKVNGWKIYHLSTQMEDLVSSFKSFSFEKEGNQFKINCVFNLLI